MCTAVQFVDKNGNLYAGRNLDWGVDFGEKPVAVPKGFTWEAKHLGQQVCNHNLLGMGIVAEGLPLFFDAANDDGLYCAGLSFAAGFAHYADAKDGKTNVASYEMPLWICGNFDSVDQVEQAVSSLCITKDAVAPTMPPTDLHWFVADAHRSLVIEQTEEGLKVYKDGFDVLTNQPEFGFHQNNMRNYMHLDTEWTPETSMRDAKLSALGVGPSMMGLPGDPSSISRFVRVAVLNANYPEEEGEIANRTRLFKTLQAVSMVKGYCKQESGNFEYTLYTGGYSQATQTYYYNTYDDPAYKSVSMDVCKTIDGPTAL